VITSAGAARRVEQRARREAGVESFLRLEGPAIDEVLQSQKAPDPGAALDWPALAAAFRAGDASAAEVLAERLLPFVARLVRRLAAWRHDVDDLIQDVMVAALAGRGSFRGDAKLETWITRIAVNRCRAQARKAWVRRGLFRSWAMQCPAASAPPAEAAAIAGEQAAMVHGAVTQLPAKYREAVVLCYLQHMTAAEAATALSVRASTVEVRLSRARAKLRKMLSP
jgi:RNA polymerase sigma-70 factor (ECF subfamily)